MSKAKRLNELIMTVNRKKRFTVGELAEEFSVSYRTILRDLQELSEMGVPLYSEVGPHGGYQAIKERILPPIAFKEDEVVAMFFALHTLKHYMSLPFEVEFESIRKKFYLNLPGDMRDKIDTLRERVDFVFVAQQEEIPFLKELLLTAIEQMVVSIVYLTGNKTTKRSIQPIGIYASGGKWYCPSYCFLREDYRLFRCDRIESIEIDHNTTPIDLTSVNINNRFSIIKIEGELALHVELTKEGVEKYQSARWPNSELSVRNDGSGYITGTITKQDVAFFAHYLITYGKNAIIQEPVELVNKIKENLRELLSIYK